MRIVLGRRARLILVGCLALAVAGAGACVAALQSPKPDVGSLTQRLDDLRRQKERVQGHLRQVKRHQSRIHRELASLDTKLDRTEAQLRKTTGDASRARTELQEATREFAQAEASLANHREDITARLVALYQQTDVRPIDVVLQTSTFGDFASRLYLLDQVVDQDAELLEEYEEATTDAEARQEILTEREQRLARLRDRIASDRRRARTERRYTEQEKRLLFRDRVAWESALAELEQDSREVEAMLQRLQQGGDAQAGEIEPWQGKLQWPLRGRISSGYGYRIHPIHHVRKMHTGIDIAVPHGTQIRAAAKGTVVHAARWGGYGNCIIIDHGGGLATLYAHCSRIAVKNGQTVAQADVVGYVGSTGISTGPHLHFEVRRDGRHVNPMPLLP